jgi:hypothetical protein
MTLYSQKWITIFVNVQEFYKKKKYEKNLQRKINFSMSIAFFCLKKKKKCFAMVQGAKVFLIVL